MKIFNSLGSLCEQCKTKIIYRITKKISKILYKCFGLLFHYYDKILEIIYVEMRIFKRCFYNVFKIVCKRKMVQCGFSVTITDGLSFLKQFTR